VGRREGRRDGGTEGLETHYQAIRVGTGAKVVLGDGVGKGILVGCSVPRSPYTAHVR
jgi:hypothetical protein